MSNITKLPDSFERQWRVYEAQIREAMVEFPQDETEHAVTSLKPVYLRAVKATPFTINATGEELVHELNAWVNKQVFTMMKEVLIREIELYRFHGKWMDGPPGRKSE